MAEHLAARYRMPKWQFTSSATQANAEVMRLAREMTGRETVLVFDGRTTASSTPPSSSSRTAAWCGNPEAFPDG